MRLLDTSKQADNFISSLPPKQFKQVYSKIISLKNNPRPHDSEKLKGSQDFFRVDVGEYRIIYKFDNTKLYISTVGNRNDGQAYDIHKRK